MLVGMVLGSLFDKMCRVQRMAVRHVGVVRRVFVIPGFAVMLGCSLTVMGSQMMMFNAFVCHGFVSGLKSFVI
jgi:hypothetical protein